MQIKALIPCRSGSERIKNKNIKPFASSSLLEIKIKQLLKVPLISEIIVSTDDEEVVKIVEKMDINIKIHIRDPYYATSECDTNSLIDYFSKSLQFEHLLWTHTTSPFIDSQFYTQACEDYIKKQELGYDSLVSVEKCREFVWNESLEAVNYSVDKLGRWPQTQKVDPLYIVNSGIFIISKELMIKECDRVGKKPVLFESSRLQSLDIDWPEDFILAEKIWKALNL